jgi:chromate transporter
VPPEPRATRDSGRRISAVALLPAGTFLVGTGEIGRLFLLTLWMGSVLFGGGYMLIALLEPYVVGQYGWLTAEQFLDGIALTQAVPGPIVTLVAFVGYAVAGVGIYLPSFSAVLLIAPWLERWRQVGWVRAVLKGVNAVVAGAIFGVALTLVPPAVPDPWTAVLLAASLLAVFRLRVGALWLVLAGIAAGVLRSALA